MGAERLVHSPATRALAGERGTMRANALVVILLLSLCGNSRALDQEIDLEDATADHALLEDDVQSLLEEDERALPLYLQPPHNQPMDIDVAKALKHNIPDLMRAVKPLPLSVPHFKPPFPMQRHQKAVKPAGAQRIDVPHPMALPPLPPLEATAAESYTMLMSPRQDVDLPQNTLAESAKTTGTAGVGATQLSRAGMAFTAAVDLLALANLAEQCDKVESMCPEPNPDPEQEEQCTYAMQACSSEYSSKEIDTCHEHGIRAIAPIPLPKKPFSLNFTRTELESSMSLLQMMPSHKNINAQMMQHKLKAQEHGRSADVTTIGDSTGYGDHDDGYGNQEDDDHANHGGHVGGYGDDQHGAMAHEADVPVLSSARVALVLPAIGSVLGQASYAKVMCRETKTRCETSDSTCGIALHQCETEVKHAAVALCEEGNRHARAMRYNKVS